MKYRQQGATLIELMISLVLGLLVAGLAVQLLLQSRNSQSTQQATSYLQESARYVVYRLKPLLRNVGYAGCGNVRQLSVANSLDASVYNMARPFGGSQSSYRGEPYWKLRFVVAEKFGSDVSLSSSMGSPSDDIIAGDFLSSGLRDDFSRVVNAGGVALITNCETADVFRLAPGTGSVEVGALGLRVSPEVELSQAYGSNSNNAVSSYLYPLRRWELMLRDQAGGTGEPALFLVDVDAPPGIKYVELVSGIADYALTVSLDTDADGQPDMLKQAPASVAAGDAWDQVVRIELAFTLRSQPGVVPNGTDDGRLTREFQLTFSPRNLPLR